MRESARRRGHRRGRLGLLRHPASFAGQGGEAPGERSLEGRHPGTLTFACVPKLNYELSSLPAGSAVDIDLNVDFIDHAAFESLHSWRLNHEKTGGKVCVEENQEEWYKPAAEGRPRCTREA